MIWRNWRCGSLVCLHCEWTIWQTNVMNISNEFSWIMRSINQRRLSFCYCSCHGVYGNASSIIKWKHFPHCWSFVRENHKSPMIYPPPPPSPRHKDQSRGALKFFYLHLNKRLSKQSKPRRRYLRRHRAHYDVTAMGTYVVTLFSTRNSFIQKIITAPFGFNSLAVLVLIIL